MIIKKLIGKILCAFGRHDWEFYCEDDGCGWACLRDGCDGWEWPSEEFIQNLSQDAAVTAKETGQG
jgi:hypothetical protein